MQLCKKMHKDIYSLLERCSKPEQIMPYISKPNINIMRKVLHFIYKVQNFLYRKLLCNSDIKPCNIMLGKIFVLNLVFSTQPCQYSL